MTKEKFIYLNRVHGEFTHYPRYVMRGLLSILKVKWQGITADIGKYI